MTAAQEGGVVASGKITVPLCVSTFSFFVNAKPGVVLTATQTYQIYSGAISAWSGVPGATGKVAGAITRVARSDKSGSTAIVKKMWSKAVSGYGDGTDGTAMTYAGLTKVEGTSAVCAAVLKTKGAIGYAFTGGCSVVYNRRKPNNPKRVIAALKNANGVAVAPPSWVPGAALVGAPPAADGSWSNVDFIWKGGAKTPAMVSMEYGFIRKSLTGVTGGKIAKAFMQFMIVKLAKGGYGFNAVPAGWRNPSIAMLSDPPLNFSPFLLSSLFHILFSPPPLAHYSRAQGQSVTCGSKWGEEGRRAGEARATGREASVLAIDLAHPPPFKCLSLLVSLSLSLPILSPLLPSLCPPTPLPTPPPAFPPFLFPSLQFLFGRGMSSGFEKNVGGKCGENLCPPTPLPMPPPAPASAPLSLPAVPLREGESADGGR
ncbi:unnamed protein product [Closterium sp. Naga37s-1]|nr:unnamed protein product [Closterium sp. Naga37s-1]